MFLLHSLRSRFTAIALLSLAALAAAAPAQDETRPTARDIAALTRVGSPAISPDGMAVAFTRSTATFDEEAKPSDSDTDAGWTRDTQIWLARVEGGAPRQLTRGDASASSPAWSPNGDTLAFRRTIDGTSKLHLLPMRGGEARALDLGELSPGAFAYSPKGDAIAFVASEPKTAEEKEAKWASGGAIAYDREWRNEHLYIINLEDGEPRKVTDGSMNVVDFAWSPDAERFAVMFSESSDPYYTFSVVRPAIVNADNGAIERWLEPEPGPHGHIEWSPDGRYIAYEKAVDSLSLMNHLVVHQLDRGARWNAASKLDPTLSGFTWTAGGDTIVAHVLEKTNSALYILAPDGSRAAKIPFDDRVISGGLNISAWNRDQLAFISSTPTAPWEVTVLGIYTGPPRPRVLTNSNPQVRDWALGNQEVVSWKSPEGMTIEGLLMVSPVAADPAPLMVMPHGGPDSVSMNSFHPWTVYFAARGYHVLRPNYRGGTAYGHEFYKANRGRLGEIEFMDIEAGVDSLIQSGRVDPDRLVYGGWSWGGYLTAWTIGHTDRYQAAVAGAAVVDVVSQYALSDINHGVAAEWEYKGNPWLQWENFDRANPMRHLHKAVTPTLIIHGMEDDRVNFSASRIMYRALDDVGCEVRMLAYPREPHGFREPAHTAHMLDAWAAWYNEHLTP
ncbi:MAG: S9 family peptidase [Planctomycetota bacterium]|nr:S9 family peptidase [Planctomycetota bacterium]